TAGRRQRSSSRSPAGRSATSSSRPTRRASSISARSTERYRMQLFVLGATGRTGVQLLDLALARGHRVTAFVRSPEEPGRRGGLAIVKGDPLEAAAMDAVLPGHDAVLSMLGPRPREALTGTTLLERSAASAIAAMGRASVARLVVVSSAMLFPVRRPL